MKKIYITIIASIVGLTGYAETKLVKDITPGEKSSTFSNLANVNGTLFFQVDDGTHGMELWKSDGTPEGTVMVKDINPGSAGSGVSTNSKLFVAIGNTIYFQATDGTGPELWKSDGTEAGTVLVKDIGPYLASQGPRNFFNFEGTLYFLASNVTNGFELWKSDGTTAGTVMVKDLNVGNKDANIKALTSFNKELYFVYADTKLYKTDGTDLGTVMVKDMSGLKISDLIVSNGSLYFVESAKNLWKSDGTDAGTVKIKDNVISIDANAEYNIIDVAGTMYFAGPAGNVEPWKSDGTAAGTVMLKEISASGSSISAFYMTPPFFTNVNGVLYFQANDGVNGKQIWKSDGTETGTVVVKNVNTKSNGAYAYPIAFKNELYFQNRDAVFGIEPWKTDGTDAGTVMVEDIGMVTNNSFLTQASPLFTVVGNTLYFIANNVGNGLELWKTDGVPVTPVIDWKEQANLLPMYNQGVFFTDVNNGIVVGEGSGYFGRTTDGGATWTKVLVPNSNNTYGVHFPDSKNGFAVGVNGTSAMVFKTTDGGASWTSKSPLNSNTLYSVYFTNSLTGYAVGTSGKMLKTIDGGENWTVLNSGVINNLNNVRFINETIGFVTGQGIVLKTTDAGATWKTLASPGTVSVKSSFFFDENTGYICAGTNIMKTIDGGVSWKNLTFGTALVSYSIYFTDVNTGYFSGEYNIVYKTTDGGITWKINSKPFTTSAKSLTSLSFPTKDVGYVVGQGGQIMKKSGGLVSLLKEEPANDAKASIYPNPANDTFVIELPEFKNTIVELFNIQGQLLQTIYPSGMKTFVDIQSLPAGVYLVKLQNPSGLVLNKIIKQ